jgi:NhaP-type Na+/H+ or K+/H+ antiporter
MMILLLLLILLVLLFGASVVKEFLGGAVKVILSIIIIGLGLFLFEQYSEYIMAMFAVFATMLAAPFIYELVIPIDVRHRISEGKQKKRDAARAKKLGVEMNEDGTYRMTDSDK